MNAANIFMATFDQIESATGLGALVVTTDMKQAHQRVDVITHDMRPTFHPLAMPNWRDCLTCWVCGYTAVTQRMFEQAPLWAKVYLAALYLEDWLMLVEELPEEPG